MSKNNETRFRIDVHHHMIPAEYVSALNRVGVRRPWGGDFPEWSPAISLDMMNNNNISMALLSGSALGVYFGDAAFSRDLARQCNEIAAGIVENHPQRFGFFAILPTPVIDAAVNEAVYALDVLKADGVGLLSSSAGQYPGDSDLDDLMYELDMRRAIVCVHPNAYPPVGNMKTDIPIPFIEFLFDTTRAIVNLSFTGTFEKYPNIRWIMSHAGGTVPYIAWRLSLMDGIPCFKKKMPRGILGYLKNLYYDTALSPSPYAMHSLRELVKPSQILFGSDFPLVPEEIVMAEIRDLGNLDFFNVSDLKLTERENAISLFPRLQHA